MMRKYLNKLRLLAIDSGGVAAMEFALLLPFMAALYFGAVEVSFLIQADRRVTNATSVMADLTARLETINYCNAEDVFAATEMILDADSLDAVSMRLTSVVENADGDIVVAWSQGRNMDARAAGSLVEITEGLMTSDGSLIIAELSYDYDSPLGYFLQDTRGLTDEFFLRPRNSEEVVWEGDGSAPDDGCGWDETINWTSTSNSEDVQESSSDSSDDSGSGGGSSGSSGSGSGGSGSGGSGSGGSGSGGSGSGGSGSGGSGSGGSGSGGSGSGGSGSGGSGSGSSGSGGSGSGGSGSGGSGSGGSGSGGSGSGGSGSGGSGSGGAAPGGESYPDYFEKPNSDYEKAWYTGESTYSKTSDNVQKRVKKATQNAVKDAYGYDWLNSDQRKAFNQAANLFGKAIKYYGQGKPESKWQTEIENGLTKLEGENIYTDVIIILHDDGTVTSYVTFKWGGPSSVVFWDERDS